MVAGDHGPAVGQLFGVAFAGVDHGLDGEDHAFLQPQPLPALAVLILIASLGGQEFKLVEVLGNMVVLAAICVVVFKVGLGMNISIIAGVW